MGSLWGGEDGEGGEWCKIVEVGVWKGVEFVVEERGGGGERALRVGFKLVVVCLFCCFWYCIVICCWCIWFSSSWLCCCSTVV